MKKVLLLLSVLLTGTSFAQSFTPVAYWEFLHPEPQGNNLRSVKMLDSLTYIAVGDQGTVVRTFDNGTSWKITSKITGFTGNLISVDFGTRSTGATVSGTTVFFTNDTGNTWRRINLSGVGTIYRVYYASPSRAFCVGKNGSIAVSADSGKTWKAVALESSDDLRDVHFFNVEKGITCATNGLRYLTNDSGKTWSVFVDEYANSMYSIDFIDGTYGAISGELGAIYLTKDGAKTWQKQNVAPQGNCNDVAILSPERTVVACDFRGVYLTSNGGSTWTNVQPWGNQSLKSISFAPDKKNGVIVGSNGMIMRTYDAGSTWEVVFDRVVAEAAGLNSIWCIDSLTAVAVGSAGLIIRTTDGGHKWSLINTAHSEPLYDVHFQTPLIGTIVGDLGLILRTRDGGLTWTKQTSNTTVTLRSVSFIDTARGIVCGSKGTILGTQNGGALWFLATGNSDTTRFADVQYITRDTAVAVGTLIGGAATNDPYIVRTVNGGMAWSVVPIQGSLMELYDVEFPTPSIGYAAGSEGEGSSRIGPIFKSFDGGLTWKRLDSAAAFSIYSMSFANAHSGTVVGLDGRTAHTSDGGASWAEVLSGTALNLYGVHHPTLHTAFGVGAKTAVIRLTTNDTIVTLSVPATPVSKKHELLRSVYPNPAHELVTFAISLEKATDVMLTLFDVKGNKVASIYEGMLPNGEHEANLDVSKLARGIYFARLDTPEGSEMMKVIVQ